MNAEFKCIYDLPEHALEEIVCVLSKNTNDLNKFYAFGLSSNLFHVPMVRTLDKENIYFPLDIGKDASNKNLMNIISMYDDETKAKFGLKFVAKDPKNLEEKLYDWTTQCWGFKKIYFDKINQYCHIL